MFFKKQQQQQKTLLLTVLPMSSSFPIDLSQPAPYPPQAFTILVSVFLGYTCTHSSSLVDFSLCFYNLLGTLTAAAMANVC